MSKIMYFYVNYFRLCIVHRVAILRHILFFDRHYIFRSRFVPIDGLLINSTVFKNQFETCGFFFFLVYLHSYFNI